MHYDMPKKCVHLQGSQRILDKHATWVDAYRTEGNLFFRRMGP